jgi:F-type H+-transporting ATPase subunit delta
VSDTRVARRYAKGLLAVAVEEKKVEEYGRELATLGRLMADSAEVRSALTNPLYTRALRGRVLDAFIQKLKLSPVMSQFLRLALEKERLRFLPEMAASFQKLVDEYQNVGRATVTAAVSIPAEAQSKIKEALQKATGKTIVLTVEQDPELIGGIKAKIGDLVLDGTVRTQLEALKNSLKRGEAI